MRNIQRCQCHIGRFAEFEELLPITVSVLTVKNELGEMVRCVQQLKQLKHLKAITMVQNFNPTSTQHDELKEHLDCMLKFHENCKFHPSDRTIEFGFDSEELKLPQNEPVLVNIVNVKDKGCLRQEMTIFDAFKRTVQFYPNVIRTVKVEANDHCKFINVSSS